MAKKKMGAEERKEYKGGKYMGGPAEERAEKKKGKRMAMGGRPEMADNMGPRMPVGQNAPVGAPIGRLRGGMRMKEAAGVMAKPVAGAAPSMLQNTLQGKPAAGAAPSMLQNTLQAKPVMRGGGLARKGVGQALNKGGKVKCMATGGLVKGAGCAQRGVKKPRMV